RSVACRQDTPQAMELTAIDNCNGNINVQFEEKLTTQGCTTTLERTWTAIDCAGNTSTHKQYITQNQDQQPPTLMASSEAYQQIISENRCQIQAAPALD